MACEFSCYSVCDLVTSHHSVGWSLDNVDWLDRGISQENFERRRPNAAAKEVLHGGV